MQEIALFCKCCKRSLHITYQVTGNEDAPVLPNVTIKCVHDKRVLTMKKRTEKMLIEGSKNGTFYM